ncbi:MAG TPA: MSMEG_6728 family protein [Mycobacteriales bacterium]|nr:MSMEG_6728 family protein [Mycobacteriales bacterium]
MQTFLPYPDLRASCAVLDDRRLGKQRVETFQILRALTWPTYAWKNHPAVRMWRGFVPGLVRYGVENCREWTRRGYADAVLPQLLAWSGGAVPQDPDLPPWFGVEELHRSHRSALLRKDPAIYRPLFGPDEADDLPYFWPSPVFPHWPLQPSLGLEPWPWQAAVVRAVQAGRDVLLVCRPGAGASTTGLLAALAMPGRTALIAPPLGAPAGPVPSIELLPARAASALTTAETIARRPGPEDLAAMTAEAEQSAWQLATVVPDGDFGLIVLDGADRIAPAVRRDGGPPVLCIVGRADADQRGALAARHGLREPLHVGAGWDPADVHLGCSTGRARKAVTAQVRGCAPALLVVEDRGQADRLQIGLSAEGLRTDSWAPGMRAARGARAVAAWRGRKLDALVVPRGPLPPLGRVRPRLLLHVAAPATRDDWRETAVTLAPDRAVIVPAPGWSAEWIDEPGCLRASLLRPYGEPVAVPCGRCDRCARGARD